jgi:hypothetical protein
MVAPVGNSPNCLRHQFAGAFAAKALVKWWWGSAGRNQWTRVTLHRPGLSPLGAVGSEAFMTAPSGVSTFSKSSGAPSLREPAPPATDRSLRADGPDLPIGPDAVGIVHEVELQEVERCGQPPHRPGRFRLRRSRRTRRRPRASRDCSWRRAC